MFCLDAVYLADAALDFNTKLTQQHLRKRTCRHTRSRLARTAASAASIVADTVLMEVGKVRMSRTKNIFDVGVVFALLVGVVDYHRYGCAGAFAFENTAEYFNLVRLFTRGFKLALARFSAIELTLDELFVNLYARRHSINDAAKCLTV